MSLLLILHVSQQGKAKYAAWKKEVDAGTQPEDAQKKYVELVEQLKSKLGYEG